MFTSSVSKAAAPVLQLLEMKDRVHKNQGVCLLHRLWVFAPEDLCTLPEPPPPFKSLSGRVGVITLFLHSFTLSSPMLNNEHSLSISGSVRGRNGSMDWDFIDAALRVWSSFPTCLCMSLHISKSQYCHMTCFCYKRYNGRYGCGCFSLSQ